MRFHISNLGVYGAGVPSDSEGYAYTTVAEYMTHCHMTREQAEDAVREQQAASEALRRWQDR